MNEKKIADLLNVGYSISEVAEELKIEKTKIYYTAKKLNLPYNKPVKSGGPKAKRIIRLSNSGFTAQEIGKIFKISPLIIKKIIKNT
tara:strand:- start:285 stop:545 length:261 start_codon:yes stop_codon:yes gene_type:complete